MVSARVFNPVLSELCKMSGSPGVTRNLDRIKRNLFGSAPTKLVDTKTPFNAELERHQEVSTQKWGFDFRADRPLVTNGSFIWERVSSQESTYAPQMYTLTRAAHMRTSSSANASATPSDMDVLLNERADRENLANSSLDSNTDSEYDESLQLAASTSAAALTASSSSSSSCYSTQQRNRQPKITEYMKERKRLAQAPKKLSPSKRMRTSSGSHSSSSSSASIGAHFGGLLKRPRNN
ncbi:hypothetical protein KR093_007792 [Drosophila rubida]|uniref:Cyclin-dependent kinase inhibitor domain-containing protein n=1 Tax=Drosophila rubida TaxID=30044 RepID=A0AAD4PQI9_9MUSC|nr:hypothetical protein KR093_007792 [Drosophila rubida]